MGFLPVRLLSYQDPALSSAICHAVKRFFRKLTIHIKAISSWVILYIYVIDRALILLILQHTHPSNWIQDRIIRLLRIYLNYSCSCNRNRRQLLFESLLKASEIEHMIGRERRKKRRREEQKKKRFLVVCVLDT